MAVRLLVTSDDLASSAGSWKLAEWANLDPTHNAGYDSISTKRYSVAFNPTNGNSLQGVYICLLKYTGATETYTIALEENTGSWVEKATSGALNVSTLTTKFGWYYIAFSTPYTATTNQFRISAVSSTTTQVGWGRSTTAADYSAALIGNGDDSTKIASGDTALIANAVTLTMNENLTLAPTNGMSLVMGAGSEFVAPNPVNPITFDTGTGSIWFSSSGALKIGTSGTPIDSAHFIWNTSLAASSELFWLPLLTITTNIAVEFYGTKSTALKLTVAANAAANQNVITTVEDIPASWADDDSIALLAKALVTASDVSTYSIIKGTKQLTLMAYRTATMTIANPCVVSITGHLLKNGDAVVFTTTGALPTGVTASTTYYARYVSSTYFHLYDTYAHAIDTGSSTGRVATSGTQSGVHTCYSPFNLDYAVLAGGAIINRTEAIRTQGIQFYSTNMNNMGFVGYHCGYYILEGIYSDKLCYYALQEDITSTTPCRVDSWFLYTNASYANLIYNNQAGGGTFQNIHSMAVVAVTSSYGFIGKNMTINNVTIKNQTTSVSTAAAVYGNNNTVSNLTAGNGSHPQIFSVNGYSNTLSNIFLIGTARFVVAIGVLVTNFIQQMAEAYGTVFLNATGKFVSSTFGVGTTNTTEDIQFTTDNYLQIECVNCNVGDLGIDASVFTTIPGSYFRMTGYNGTAGDNRSWYPEGYFVSDGDTIEARNGDTTNTLVNTYALSTGAVATIPIRVSAKSNIVAANFYGGTHTNPTLEIEYDGGTIATVAGTDTLSEETLASAITPTTSYNPLTVRLKQKSDAAAVADREVAYYDLGVVMRPYGYLETNIQKELTKTTSDIIADVVVGTADPVITEVTVGTVAAYTGIAVTHASSLIAVTAAHTSAQLYDYCQYNLGLEANLDKSRFFYSVDGGFSYTTNYDITINGFSVTATDKTLRMGAKTLTLTSGGIWTGIVDGAITITTAGTYSLNIGSEAVTFTAVGSYDLSGGDIAGTIELINTSGGAVTVILAAGVSYTNTGPNITVSAPSVYITVSGIVSGSRLYVYDTITATEIYNDIPAGASQQVTITSTGNLTTVKLRKAGYKTWETTTTPGTAGASVTGAQEADDAYNASYNAGMATDWSVNTTTKKLARGTTNWNTVRDFHSYWNALFAGETYMEFDVPTSAFTKYEIQFENGYSFNAETDFQKLKTGSIADPVADDLWGSIITLGNAAAETVYLVQDDAEVTSYWSTGNIDVLLKVKATGTLIDSGIVHVYCRDFNYIFDHTSLTITEGGKNYASLNVGSDSNNQTASATVAGYSDIVLDETGVTVDITSVAIDGDDTPATYTLGVDGAGRTVEEIYEYLKYATRHNSAFTINGDAGEEHYRYSTYTEVKNSPLGQLIGGVFYGAQGVWLTNVATADALNYVLVDNAGSIHQAAIPPVEFGLSGLVAGSRVQLYNVGTSTELYNAVVAGTTVSITATAGHTIRYRVTMVDGAGTAYKWLSGTGVVGSGGTTLTVNQEVNTVYTTNGIDGSTVTECSISGTNIRIYVDDPDNTISAQRIYNWYQYILTTEAGIRDQDGAYISATDSTHYVFDNSMKIANQDTVNPLNLTGANIVPVSGASTNIFDLSNGASIALNFNRVEGFAYSSGSGLSTEEHDAVLAIKAKTDYIPSKTVASKADINSLK